ncbi:hypothetical protein QM012_003361 [Aureobasidium pullulans]|uniref:Aminoglycoside phosphotransferase domain-containing protein n=1 Tax=Aureobasidium pullulans TaxID=5580 RepID=A0ABR0T9M6_AURPU
MFYLLSRPQQTQPNQPDDLSLEKLEKLEHQLIHEAGSCNAVWLIGNEAVCKAQAWKEGLQLESETIALVREQAPSIPGPEVIYSWIDEAIDRSFLIMRRVHARTLDSAWPQLKDQQRLNIAREVAAHTATLAQITCDHLQTISGYGIRTPRLMQGYNFHSPIHNWFPRTIGPFSGSEYGDYMRSISSAPPPEFGDTMVLFHDDQGPTNILVSDDGNNLVAIIDWANAAYFPRFWVATVPVANTGGFWLSDGSGDSWARMLVAALKTHGLDDKLEEWKSWRDQVSDPEQDTEKDMLEWSRVRQKGIPGIHDQKVWFLKE